jgi:IMP dehydrogenase
MQEMALTFDDIQLIPRYSEIESRQTLDLQTKLTRNTWQLCPIIAAPMDTVCEAELINAIGNVGATGCIHRFNTINEQVNIVKAVQCKTSIVAAIGATGDCIDRAAYLLGQNTRVLLIDVAHGHHINVERTIKTLKDRFSGKCEFEIIAGNVATADGAYALALWGADAIRVGIGPGAVCETRIRTGVGVPQLTAIKNAKEGTTLPIIADGGIRTSGDIVKALAFGASTVMIGSLLAGTPEASGEVIEIDGKLFKKYRGSASADIKLEKSGIAKNVEGTSTLVPLKEHANIVLTELLDGVRSGMSYLGAATIPELHKNCSYVTVSAAGLREAHPHLVMR